METVARAERKSFGVVGLLVVAVGLLGLIFLPHWVFALAVIVGGAIGAIDWRTPAGKAAAVLALVGLVGAAFIVV